MDNLVQLIQDDIHRKECKYEANKYYKYKGEQLQRYIDIVDTQGNIKTIDTGNQTNLYINFFKLLVDQKIEYLLAHEAITNFDNDAMITDTLIDGEYDSSLNGTAWLYFYLNEGKLEWTWISDQNIIPFYKNYGKELESLIYYEKKGTEIFVEIWTSNNLAKYVIKNNTATKIGDYAHFTIQSKFKSEVIDENGGYFKSLPFIPLYNNRSHTSDLEGIKELLDIYNSISSGFVSNIKDFQEAIIKLTGFSNNEEELSQAMDNIKQYKMVGIPKDGGLDYMKIEIPVEPRKVLLDICKDNIFLLGRGVDSTKVGDGNITNIVIQSRYANLDMKCNNVEKEIKKFYSKFVDFYNTYNNTDITKDITFNRTILINKTEAITGCVESIKLLEQGLISKETLIKNHPWVDNYELELDRIKQDKPQI